MRVRNQGRRFWICVILLVAATGCVGTGDAMTRTWTPAQPHPLLRGGAMVRNAYYPMICPRVDDAYVVLPGGSFVQTLDELRVVLRPIDTVERALAYRSFLGDIELERDETLRALQHTTPLDYDEGKEPFYGVYVAADAQRWGVGREPLVEMMADRIVITQPSFHLSEYPPVEGKAWDLEASRVELVRETIYRDGRYVREVVRVLEQGKAALVHEPAPLL